MNSKLQRHNEAVSTIGFLLNIRNGELVGFDGCVEILWESVMNCTKTSFNNGKKREICRYSDNATGWADRGVNPGRGKELNELIRNADTVRFIKSRRMNWVGHVMRMGGRRIPRRILEWKPIGRRIRGRPRKRWIEDAEENFQAMGIRGWRKLSKERTEWKKITEMAKTRSGL
jgi:hypothetical protein